MLFISVAQNVDILMLSETKLESTFPSIQSLINGFSVPRRLDRNSKGGDILLYVKDKIIVLPLNRYSPHIEILFTSTYRRYSVLLNTNGRKKI